MEHIYTRYMFGQNTSLTHAGKQNWRFELLQNEQKCPTQIHETIKRVYKQTMRAILPEEPLESLVAVFRPDTYSK